MNKLVSANKTTVPVQDESWVAEMAVRQLKAVVDGNNSTVVHLFLKDSFALGYMIGFAIRAGQNANTDNGSPALETYLRNVIGSVVGDLASADSFVCFANSKQGDRMFEGGYDAGQSDLDALFWSHGANLPNGLAQHVEARREDIQILRGLSNNPQN